MLRIASALARAATTHAPLHSLAETCARAVGCCTQLQDVSQFSYRSYSALPDPDPEVNGEPSKRVLEMVDHIENLTVRDLVWLNKLLKERLGLEDDMMGMGMAMPMGMPMGGAAPAAAAAAAPEPAAPPVAEKTEFKVVVEGYDASAKIKIIKEVRAVLPDLGLKDAKDLVDKIPATIKSGLSKTEADELKAKLEAVGAKVKLD